MTTRVQPIPLAEPQRASRAAVWARREWVGLLLTLAVFALYMATLVPGPFDGDSGEFQYLPRVLGLPHPTGFPLHLLLGWAWSWLPVGTVAFRMNLFSALGGALTAGALFAIARQQGLGRVAALGGAAAFALAPGFWRYAVVGDVYALHTLLVAATLLLWLRWAARVPREGVGSGWRRFWLAAFVTGLGLTNHPTFAFTVLAVALFVGVTLAQAWRAHARGSPASARPARRSWWRGLLLGAVLFALPGLLYLYVPVRLWQLDPPAAEGALDAAHAKGVVSPFIRSEWGREGVVGYILGRSFVQRAEVDVRLLPQVLPGVLQAEFGLPVTLLGVVGAALWLWRRPASFALLGALFLVSSAYAVTFLAGLAGQGEELDPITYLLPAMMVGALWAAQGVEALVQGAARLLRRPTLAAGVGVVVLALALGWPRIGMASPTAADQQKSRDIRHYWTEVLAYPLEPEAALTGHWGDLTPFWYFQHGEGRRPDLSAIYPPNVAEMDRWLAEQGRPLYLAGPLLDWSPDLLGRYSLTPWGILVRVAPPGSPVLLPPMEPRAAAFGGQVQLEGYRVEPIEPGREQLWLQWRTLAPTPRDLSVSVRLHAADGASLFQEDGRLASLWYPDGTLPPELPFLSVFDLDLPPDLPPDATVRIVVYDPATGQPLLTAEGQDVWEVGPLATPNLQPLN